MGTLLSLNSWFVRHFLLTFLMFGQGKYDNFDNIYFVFYELSTVSLFWFTQV